MLCCFAFFIIVAMRICEAVVFFCFYAHFFCNAKKSISCVFTLFNKWSDKPSLIVKIVML